MSTMRNPTPPVRRTPLSTGNSAPWVRKPHICGREPHIPDGEPHDLGLRATSL